MAGTLASCGSGSGGGGGATGATMKFWDQPWAEASYVEDATKLVTEVYEPGEGFTWTYDQVQWNNFYQTYQSAVASNTNPAASTGGGFQAIGLSGEGAIHYADNIIEQWEADGTVDDFLPGILDKMKTDEGYVQIPWAIDVPTLYYLQSVHADNGLEPPKTWDDIYNNGKVLKEQGIDALIIGAGTGNNRGNQTLNSLMINNGGGLFDENGELDCLFDRNVEAIEFVLKLVTDGMINPSSVNYTEDNMATVWTQKQGAVGFQPPNWQIRFPEMLGDMFVSSPLEGPHGDKGALMFINGVMMYQNTPSIEEMERFVAWYTTNNDVFWTNDHGTGLTVRQSVIDQLGEDAERDRIYNEWVPIGQGMNARSPQQFPDVAKVDGSAAFFTFAQLVLSGDTNATDALQKLQDDLSKVIG
ncbi:MAG: ABC transporter substrate-binding protein [Beutenbergiaceae bacterium]